MLLLSNFSLFGQMLTRGPYLQIGSPTGITVRWNTSEAGAAKIMYGESLSAKSKSVSKPELTKIHEIRIENLKPKTKYYYSIYQNDVLLDGDSTNYFVTSPVPGSSKDPVRMVAFGDCGTLQPAQVEVAKRVSEYFGGKPIDGWLLLGDNAYNNGFDSQYQTNFFDIYQKFFLKNTVLWPSPGNHDYSDLTWPSFLGDIPDYFKVFSLPSKGESGGVASGTGAYYSYDYGNVHFVSLDSYGTEDSKKMYDTLSKQVVWLKKDLAANKLPWTVVYFHHPPYTKGSHDSDKDLDLIAIREKLIKVLDQYKVDLVLNGHSHNYERSYMLNKYYTDELSFNLNTHAISNSSGRYDGSPNSCPYIRAGSGTVYVVAGTAGWVGGTKPGYPHNAMVTSNSEDTGALILEVNDNKLELKYLTAKGVVFDQFTIFKDVNKKTQKTIECGELVSFGTSWKGELISTVGKVENNIVILDSLNKGVQFTVTDKNKCLRDTIQVIVKPYLVPKASSNSPVMETTTLQLDGKLAGLGTLSWKGASNFTAKGDKQSIENVKLSNAGKYFLISNYKNCTSKDSIQVEILRILSSEVIDSESISVFPNPTNGMFEVQVMVTVGGDYEPILINSSGKVIKEFKKKRLEIGKNKFEVDLSGNDNGLYFFVLRSNGEVLTSKILKK